MNLAANSSFSTTTARPLKIALLGYRSHPHVGGQGIYLKHLSEALHKLGHDVHVYSGPPYPDLAPEIKFFPVPSLDLYSQENHVKALRFRHLKSITDFGEWWTMLTGGFGEPYSFGRRIFKKLKNSHYDIIHDNQSLSFGLLKLQQHGKTVVSTIHHPIHRDRELAVAQAADWKMRLLARRWHSFLNMQEKVTKKLKHVVTVSQQSQQDIQHYFKRASQKTPVIFNGVDTHQFRPLPHIKEEPLTLLTTSSSDQPMKGVRYLLLAIKKILPEFPTLRLHFIGQLQKDGSSQQLIQALDMHHCITFHSQLSQAALITLYNRASIVVCPSIYEGFGLPAAEALACGRAVISSDGGALPEVVGDAGVIVNAGDADALAQAIQQLWNNPPQRRALQQKARQRAIDHFCWQRVAGELSQYYQALLKD